MRFLLKMDDGTTYRTEHRIAPVGFEKLGRASVPVKIYVEGVVLLNGSGSFYSLKLMDLRGNDLVSVDSLMRELSMSRETFSFPFLVFVFFTELVLWSGAFFYASQIRDVEFKKLQKTGQMYF